MDNKYRFCSARGWMEYDSKLKAYKMLGSGLKFSNIVAQINSMYKWSNIEVKITINLEPTIVREFWTEFSDWDVSENIVFANSCYFY